MSTDRAMSRPERSPLQPILTEIRPVPAYLVIPQGRLV